MDDIYNNSPLGSSGPTNFVHQVHVGFDPVSGAFTGLPEQWTRLLTSSAITKEDYARNPQAVLDVLEFYTENQKRGDWTATPNATMPDYIGTLKQGPSTLSASSVPPATRFRDGTGLAGSSAHSSVSAQSMARSASGPSTSSSTQSHMPQYPSTTASKSSVSLTPNAQPRRNQDDYFTGSRDTSASTAIAGSATPAAGQALRSPQHPGSNPYTGSNTAAIHSSRTAPAPPSSYPGSASSGKSLPSAPSQQSSNNLRNTGGQSPQRAPEEQVQASNIPSESARPMPPTARPAPPPPSSSILQTKSNTGAAPVKSLPSPEVTQQPHNAHQQMAAAALHGKSAPAAKAPGAQNGGQGDKRISTMTEAQITAKLKSVVSPQDPSKLYSKIKKVGQGASGSVYVAKTLETGAKVAIKQMDLSAQPRKELIVNEILVMKDSKHPNIVNFLDSFLVKNTELWVVMEYMEGGALTDVIDNNTLEEDQISSICFEVSHGIRLI
jgi:hypothetical protein